MEEDSLLICETVGEPGFKNGKGFTISTNGDTARLSHNGQGFDGSHDYYSYFIFTEIEGFGFRALRMGTSGTENSFYDIILGGELTVSFQEDVINAIATYSNSANLEAGYMTMRCEKFKLVK